MSDEHVPLPLPDVVRSTMVKRVNVIAQFPVRTVYPNIYGSYVNIMLPPDVILKILLAKGQVEEVLFDGTIVPLDFSNYNVVHNPDDFKVKERAKEYRQEATATKYGDIRDVTMYKLKNHTASLPRSHYLYNLKEECPVVDLEPHEEAERRNMERIERIVKRDSMGENPYKFNDLPTLDTETGQVSNRKITPVKPEEPTMTDDELLDTYERYDIDLDGPELYFLRMKGGNGGDGPKNESEAEERFLHQKNRFKHKGRYLLR